MAGGWETGTSAGRGALPVGAGAAPVCVGAAPGGTSVAGELDCGDEDEELDCEDVGDDVEDGDTPAAEEAVLSQEL